MRGRGRDRPPEARDVPRGKPRAAVAVALLERRSKADVHERLAAEALDQRRLEAAVRQDADGLVLELRERAHAVRRQELLLGSEAVDALLGVDDEDPLVLVDAVDGTDVHARQVFDVDAGLSDDVRHDGS